MIKLQSAYLCVKDMNRAIAFYEQLFECTVLEYHEIYSVFDVAGFRLGLFAFEKQQEQHEFGNNCLLSIEVESLDQLKEKIKEQVLVFPITKINQYWVCEIKDSEGNQLELTALVSEE